MHNRFRHSSAEKRLRHGLGYSHHGIESAEFASLQVLVHAIPDTPMTEPMARGYARTPERSCRPATNEVRSIAVGVDDIGCQVPEDSTSLPVFGNVLPRSCGDDVHVNSDIAERALNGSSRHRVITDSDDGYVMAALRLTPRQRPKHEFQSADGGGRRDVNNPHTTRR